MFGSMWVPGTVTSNPFRKFFSGPQVVCSLAYTDQHPSEEPMGTFYSFSEFILCTNLSHLIFYLATSRNLLSWTLSIITSIQGIHQVLPDSSSLNYNPDIQSPNTMQLYGSYLFVLFQGWADVQCIENNCFMYITHFVCLF